MKIKVRICQPFDQVCLQGGCGYCRDKPKRLVSEVRKLAIEKGWEADLDYGMTGNLANQD